MRIVQTNDGSSTVIIPASGLTYHSLHGAIQESKHVFSEAGLNYYINQHRATEIHIFEMGFGTGLNCLLSFGATNDLPLNIYYTAIDLYPLPESIYKELNYCEFEPLMMHRDVFQRIHNSPWDQEVLCSPKFQLQKIQADIRYFMSDGRYDIIYFDAFSPVLYPGQWTAPIFKMLYDVLNEHGLLVTYSSKVLVRRALEAAGFIVNKIPGPHGKREIVRALKQK